MGELIIPKRDLVADFRQDAEEEEGGVPLSNRLLRLHVAMFMLDTDSMREAIGLYEGSGRGDLLDAPGHLETSSLVAEVMQLDAIRGSVSNSLQAETALAVHDFRRQ
jgi:hypothetical protein